MMKAAALGAILLMLDVRSADACIPIQNTPFEIDPSVMGVAPPDAFSVDVSYGQTGGSKTCNRAAAIYIDASPTTACPNFDATPRCGYRFSVIDGTPFAGLPKIPIGESFQGYMVFYVETDATIDVTVEIRAVNRIGEEGPPTVVHLAHAFDDGSGCNATGTSSAGLLVLALVGVRRRRRASS